MGKECTRNHSPIFQGAVVTTVLVTGANGFIGRRVLSAAVKAGHCVTALVRRAASGDSCHVVRHDLRLPLGDLPAADWVFHLAGAYAGADYQELYRADAKMAENVLTWGLKAGIKNWVVASAAEVYGNVESVATEKAPTRPLIPYGRIKLKLEQTFIERLTNIPDCRVAILRIGEVYGSESRLIGELTSRLKLGFCPWPGSGRVRVSFVHVEDVAQAFLCALQHAGLGVSIYNVADDVPASWHVFVCSVAAKLGTKPPMFLPVRLVQCYAACSTLLCWITHRQPVLTQHALRLLMTPKVLSNARLKCELGFRLQYPSSSEGMEEALRGLSHNTKDGAA